MQENASLIDHLQAVLSEMSPAELMAFRKQLRGSLPDYIKIVSEQARATVAARPGKQARGRRTRREDNSQ